MWQDVRDPVHGKLLFRYDPQHDLVEVGSRGVFHVVDLTIYRPSFPTDHRPPQNPAPQGDAD